MNNNICGHRYLHETLHESDGNVGSEVRGEAGRIASMVPCINVYYQSPFVCFYFGYLKPYICKYLVLFPARVQCVLIVQAFVGCIVLALDNKLVLVSSFRSQSNSLQF